MRNIKQFEERRQRERKRKREQKRIRERENERNRDKEQTYTYKNPCVRMCAQTTHTVGDSTALESRCMAVDVVAGGGGGGGDIGTQKALKMVIKFDFSLSVYW